MERNLEIGHIPEGLIENSASVKDYWFDQKSFETPEFYQNIPGLMLFKKICSNWWR